jgi:hypothetical protein
MDGVTQSVKEEHQLQTSTLKEKLLNTKEHVGSETMKAYKLFCCFVAREAQTQLDKIAQEMHTCDPSIWTVLQRILILHAHLDILS